ncbi:hypothetical protein GCM10010363_69790 [Streptomyces omiyaensis]|uniref:hypothetical protein n=1 Tax=Streptomyces omiyaensis TaxID=68247 RepID=UPI001675F9BF|nr:hypothetical protein [Streptomyces omiyaensis]GGY78903.1 hypothetical protein GCM10010363_69790 [Streptomyces omiyaensis]
MPATLTLTSHRPSSGEVFDTETLALLDELDVPLPVDLDDAEVDLDIAFGTPLAMYEPAGTAREMRRYAAAVLTVPPDRRHELALAHGAEITARVDASRDILAIDPSITARIRKRLVDVLLPHTAHLRRTIRSGARPEYAAA